MLVDIIQGLHNHADFWSGGRRNRFVMLQKASDNDVDIAFFDEFGRGARNAVEGFEMREKALIELLILKVCRQSFRLKDSLKIVGITLSDNQYVIGVIGGGFELVYSAFVYENQFVFLSAELLLVNRAVDGAVGYIQNFDAAMKMRLHIVMRALEKFNRIRFVVKGFVKDILFHDVNIW